MDKGRIECKIICVLMYLCKSEFNNKFKIKVNCKSQNIQIALISLTKINSTNKINYHLNHLHKIK